MPNIPHNLDPRNFDPKNLDPRNLDRKKQILIAAAAIALSYASRNKSITIGKKIYSTVITPQARFVMADIVDNGYSESERMTGIAILDEKGQLIDVIPDESEADPSEEMFEEYDQAFLRTDWSSNPSETPLQEE